MVDHWLELQTANKSAFSKAAALWMNACMYIAIMATVSASVHTACKNLALLKAIYTCHISQLFHPPISVNYLVLPLG